MKRIAAILLLFAIMFFVALTIFCWVQKLYFFAMFLTICCAGGALEFYSE